VNFRLLLSLCSVAIAVAVFATSLGAKEETTLPITCAVTKASAFRSMQPCMYCRPKGDCRTPAERLIWESQQAVARGDMKVAIEKMEAAVERAHRIAAGPGPWAHLAELYCVQATREKDVTAGASLRRKGLNLLREHHCAQRMQKSLVCALPNWRNQASREWTPQDEIPQVNDPNPTAEGFVPNPDVPPMCFAAFCGAGFQNDLDGERRSTTYNVLVDDEEGSGAPYYTNWLDVLHNDDQRIAAAAEKWCNARSGDAR
jgi:hypothetical protein